MSSSVTIELTSMAGVAERFKRQYIDQQTGCWKEFLLPNGRVPRDVYNELVARRALRALGQLP